MCDPPILRVKLSPCAHCFFQSSAAIQSGVIVCSRFQPFTAETVSFWIIKHKPNRKATFRITHSPFNHHFRVTGWPAGFIGVLYSLFLRFNRVNLWLFSIFFHFSFFWMILHGPVRDICIVRGWALCLLAVKEDFVRCFPLWPWILRRRRTNGRSEIHGSYSCIQVGHLLIIPKRKKWNYQRFKR